MQIVNLTPHEINILDENKEPVVAIPASGQVARCSVTKRETRRYGNIVLYETIFGDIEGLPDSDGSIFIVSLVVRQAAKDRLDLFSPGELVRGTDGQPIGCIGLTR